jgi:hypothetical protein
VPLASAANSKDGCASAIPTVACLHGFGGDSCVPFITQNRAIQTVDDLRGAIPPLRLDRIYLDRGIFQMADSGRPVSLAAGTRTRCVCYIIPEIPCIFPANREF